MITYKRISNQNYKDILQPLQYNIYIYNHTMLFMDGSDSIGCAVLSFVNDSLCMALYNLYCAGVPLRNCSLIHLSCLGSATLPAARLTGLICIDYPWTFCALPPGHYFTQLVGAWWMAVFVVASV